jgi:hypothetical protein
MIRPPRARVALTCSQTLAETCKRSACIVCWRISSTRMGENVPAPTCKVIKAISIPIALICSSMALSKWSPAVGAATAPSCSAYTV